MKQLIAWGSISQEAVQFLKILVVSKYNIFVSGGTGSGRTTFATHYLIIFQKMSESLQLKTTQSCRSKESRNPVIPGGKECQSGGRKASGYDP